MNATTTTEKTKSVGRRTAKKTETAKPDAAAVGGQDSTGSAGVTTLSARLAVFGYHQNPAWSDEALVEVNEWLNEVEADRKQVLNGDPVGLTERVTVTHWLDGWEAVTADQIIQASELGRNAAVDIDMTSEHCPYPVDTALAGAWHDAFEKNAIKSDEPEKPAQTNAQEAHAVAEKKAVDLKARDAAEQQQVIERLQTEIEDAGNEAADLEDTIDSLKSELKEVKAAFDDAGLRVRKASRKLTMARRGFFDRPSAQKPLPGIAAPFAGDSLDVDSPAKPAVDEGASISLDYLTKGELQEYIPGTPDDRGLSGKQVETLKQAVGGETIGDLEKFQKAKGQWWTKEINGFGKETITKLQDVQEVIRRKFPVPDPDDVDSDVDESNPQTSDLCRKAVKDLQDLIVDCDEVIDDGGASEDGDKFCKSVKSQAESMKATILETDRISDDQLRAIKNWNVAVGRWVETVVGGDSDSGEAAD